MHTGSSSIPRAPPVATSTAINTKLPRRWSSLSWRQSGRTQCCTTTRRRRATPPPCPPTSPTEEAPPPAPRPASPPRSAPRPRRRRSPTSSTSPSSSSTKARACSPRRPTGPATAAPPLLVARQSVQPRIPIGARRRRCRSGRGRGGSRSGPGRRSRFWTTATSGGSTARSPSRTAPTQGTTTGARRKGAT